MYKEDSSEKTWLQGESPAMDKIKINLKMIESAEDSFDHNMIEEPVSPPPCDPEEGPPLIFSQSIEDLAREVVDENRKFIKVTDRAIFKTANMDINDIPSTIEVQNMKKVPNLIPVTVSEISCGHQSSADTCTPTLHMSGGMVSTDMSLHMASVPTSVITVNTSKHSEAGNVRANIENKMEQQGGIDSILQYFISANFTPPCSKSTEYLLPSLPLDLSVARLPLGSKRKVDEGTSEQSERGKKKKEEMQDDGNMRNLDRSIGVLKTISNENDPDMKSAEMKQDKLVCERKNSVKTNESAVIIVEEEKEIKSNESKDMDCKLILPKHKGEKARIIFTNGASVEIDRELFRNFEEQTLTDKRKYQKKEINTDMNVASKSRNIRRKKAMSRKKGDNQAKIMSTDLESDRKESSTSNANDCDKSVKDMPVFVTNECPVEEKYKIFVQNEAIDKPSETVQPSKDKPTNETSTQSYTPSLHKLPSIVCQPSYLSKCKNRKMNVIR